MQYSLLNACNAKCVYCNCPEREDPRASLEMHRHALGEFARLGAVRIKFLGGEPLLHHDLPELVRIARGHGMRTAIVTNGFLIPQRMDLMKQFDDMSSPSRSESGTTRSAHGTWKKVTVAVDACANAEAHFFLSAVAHSTTTAEVDGHRTAQIRVLSTSRSRQPNVLPRASNYARPDYSVRHRKITAKKPGPRSRPPLYGRTLQGKRPRERDERPVHPRLQPANPPADGCQATSTLLLRSALQPRNAFRDGVETACATPPPTPASTVHTLV